MSISRRPSKDRFIQGNRWREHSIGLGIEFGSAVLSDIAGLYSAADAVAFHIKREALQEKFARLEAQLGEGPFFSGKRFSLVDTVFGPVFRYIDCFERIDEFGLLEGNPRLRHGGRHLAKGFPLRPRLSTTIRCSYGDSSRDGNPT